MCEARPVAALAFFLVTFAAFFDTHAQMPILAPYAISLGATPFLVGVTVGLYSLTNILGNGMSGALIDARGWQLPLVLGLGSAVVLLFAYSAVHMFPFLLLVRALHGLAGGLLVPASLAAVMSVAPSGHRNRSLGFFGAAVGLAALTGPPLAGILAQSIGYRLTYRLLSGIMFIVFGVGLAVMRRSRAVPQHEAANTAGRFDAISRPACNLWFPAIAGFLLLGATATLIGFLPSAAARAGLTDAITGKLFGTFALVAILVQVFWAQSSSTKNWKPTRIARTGLLLVHIALLLFMGTSTRASFFGVAALYGMGFGLAFPSMLRLTIRTNSVYQNRGQRIGYFFAAYSLGGALIPPLAGLLWQRFPPAHPFSTSFAIGILGMGILTLLERNAALLNAES